MIVPYIYLLSINRDQKKQFNLHNHRLQSKPTFMKSISKKNHLKVRAFQTVQYQQRHFLLLLTRKSIQVIEVIQHKEQSINEVLLDQLGFGITIDVGNRVYVWDLLGIRVWRITQLIRQEKINYQYGQYIAKFSQIQKQNNINQVKNVMVINKEQSIVILCYNSNNTLYQFDIFSVNCANILQPTNRDVRILPLQQKINDIIYQPTSNENEPSLLLSLGDHYYPLVLKNKDLKYFCDKILQTNIKAARKYYEEDQILFSKQQSKQYKIVWRNKNIVIGIDYSVNFFTIVEKNNFFFLQITFKINLSRPQNILQIALNEQLRLAVLIKDRITFLSLGERKLQNQKLSLKTSDTKIYILWIAADFFVIRIKEQQTKISIVSCLKENKSLNITQSKSIIRK